jgi:hypothetical protein
MPYVYYIYFSLVLLFAHVVRISDVNVTTPAKQSKSPWTEMTASWHHNYKEPISFELHLYTTNKTKYFGMAVIAVPVLFLFLLSESFEKFS